MNVFFKATLILLALTTQALAAGGAHGDDHGIPWSTLIIPQIVNTIIFFGILIYLLRQPIKEFFAGKEAEFTSAVRKAADAKKVAEQAHAEIKNRLNSLEANAEVSRKAAVKESADLKQRLIKEAQEAAVKSAAEAEKGIAFEHERAIAALRTELVSNSIKVAQEQVRTGADPAVLAGLQKSFAKKAMGAQR